MSYTVAQAAKAIGKSKNTVFRAISSGRISAARDMATGAFRIDPSELHRVFSPVSREAPQIVPDGAVRVAVLEARLSEKEALIAVLERANDDLRRRLDVADEERRRLTAILADQRATRPVEPAPEPPGRWRRWWRR